jgi:hypothetical protein
LGVFFGFGFCCVFLCGFLCFNGFPFAVLKSGFQVKTLQTPLMIYVLTCCTVRPQGAVGWLTTAAAGDGEAVPSLRRVQTPRYVDSCTSRDADDTEEEQQLSPSSAVAWSR